MKNQRKTIRQRRTVEQRCKSVSCLLPKGFKLQKSRASPEGMHDNPQLLQPCGIKSIEDVFQKPTTTTFKMIVPIAVAGEDDAEKCVWKLETLLKK